MGGLMEGIAGFGSGYVKGREIRQRDQQLLMQKKQLNMQQERLEQAEDERRINQIFNYAESLRKMGASDTQIMNAMRPLNELTDGVIDISQVRFEKGQTGDLVQFCNKGWEQYKAGEVPLENLQRAWTDKMATLPKQGAMNIRQREHLESQLGLLEIERERVGEEQETRAGLLKEYRGYKEKGWGEAEYPGAEEMRFPGLGEGKVLYGPSPEEKPTFEEKEKIKARVKAKYPTPEKPITVHQINTKLQQLSMLKARLQTTKGVDPTLLFMMEGSPEAQKAYQEGNVDFAVKEMDKQIKYYEGLRAKRQGKKILDINMAREYLTKAGGNKEKARALAVADGYEF